MMRKNISRISIFIPMILLAAISENSCNFLKEISTLGKCEFRVTTLEDPEIAGVDISQIHSFTDLNFVDMGIISSSFLRGDLPLSFTLNVEVRNPNPAMAALNGLEYLAFIDDVEVARGQLDRRIEIPANGGITTIPLRLSTDLIDILKKDSRQALVNFGLNLADAGNRPTRVSIKVKPTILVGAMEINYPGYFTVKHDFTSGD
ncbi:MAG: LEA type 2 family protein [Bacteroidales bacterium]|nr:LEA type 2 family protein [Bacteroidales bacterium]